MTKVNKKEAHWERPDLLRIEAKKPEMAYKWGREDNVERLRDEGWVPSTDQNLKADRIEGDGAQLNTNVRRRELVLMEMPAEKAEARKAYFQAKGEEQLKAVRERYQEEAERRGFKAHQEFDRR